MLKLMDKKYFQFYAQIFCLSQPVILFRCLRTLARLARHSRDRTPIDRLRFRCPSCRKLNAARPIIRRRAAINYAIKELVDDWFQSPYSVSVSKTCDLELFLCSTQLNTKFILLINVKMPTIVGILTFISMINTAFERLKVRNFFICGYCSFYEQMKFCAHLS